MTTTQPTSASTKHSCSGPTFGRLARPGTCARCDELRAGAEPRSWGGRGRREQSLARLRAEIARHYDAAGRCACGPVCTRFDW